MSRAPKIPTGPMDSWTTEDQIKARHEGWLFMSKHIVWTGVTKGKPTKEVRTKTAAVRRYVQRRAEEGSEFHQRALALLVAQRLTS